MEEWRVSIAPKVSPSVNPFKYAFGIFVTVSLCETFSPHALSLPLFSRRTGLRTACGVRSRELVQSTHYRRL